MAHSEFEIKRCEKLVGAYVEAHRPPVHIRNKLDLRYRIENQSVVIFEVRSLWDRPDEMIEEMVAKTTYVKKSGRWKVYWQRADLKWHGYKPVPEVESLEDFLDLIEQDKHCCFFG